MVVGRVAGMLSVVDRVLDHLPDVSAVEAVENVGALAPRAYQPGHPQLGQVLGHPGSRSPDGLGEFADGEFTVEQRPQQLQAGGVGEHPQHLDRQVDMLLGRHRPYVSICIHTQIVTRRMMAASAWRYGR